MCKTDMEAAQFIAQSLNRKLQHKSALVIIKALKVIKYIANKGNQNFIRCMSRETATIRELQTFRGEPDPFRGEKPNQHVRELAKDLLPILYNPPVPQTQQNQLSLQGKIQGFGNQHSMDLKQINQASTFGTSAFGAANRPGGHPPLNRNSGSYARTGPTSLAWNQVGGGVQSGFLNQAQQGSAYQQPYRQLSLQSQDSAFSSSTMYNSVEERIVGEISTEANGKSVPLDNDIVNFLDFLAKLNGRKVGSLLNQKLTSTSSQVQFKAIYVLEKVIEQANSQACQDVAQYFMENPIYLRQLSNSHHKKIRTRAKKLKLFLLGEEDQNPEEVEAEIEAKQQEQAAAAAGETAQKPPIDGIFNIGGSKEEAKKPQQEQSADLLGDLLADSGPTQASPQPQTQPQPQAKPQPKPAGDDLLGDLQDPAPPQSSNSLPSGFQAIATPQPQGQANPLADFDLTQPQAQKQTQPQPVEEDLFSGLTLTKRPIGNVQQSPPIQPTQQSTGLGYGNPLTKSLDSHFNNVQNNKQQVQNTQPPQDLFGNTFDINQLSSNTQTQNQVPAFNTQTLPQKQPQFNTQPPKGKDLADQMIINFGAYQNQRPMAQQVQQKQGLDQNVLTNSLRNDVAQNDPMANFTQTFPAQGQRQGISQQQPAFGFTQPIGKPQQNLGQTQSTYQLPGQSNSSAFDFISDELNKTKLK